MHAMNDIFYQATSQAALLVDAKNAFNSLNRRNALVNLRYLCPALSIFAINFYRSPSKLFLLGGSFIFSLEGTTQGCNIAMPMYCICLRPLIDALATKTGPECSQIFYADDGSAVGKIVAICTWWDELERLGSGYVYHPESDK